MKNLPTRFDGWRKSTFSGEGNCVEVRLGDVIQVRDTKQLDGPVLEFTADEWSAFLLGVRANEFDQI